MREAPNLECMAGGIHTVDEISTQGELALSSIQARVDLVFEQKLGSVILQPLLTGVANTCCVIANLSSDSACCFKNNCHKQVMKNIENVTTCRDSRKAKSKETREG